MAKNGKRHHHDVPKNRVTPLATDPCGNATVPSGRCTYDVDSDCKHANISDMSAHKKGSNSPVSNPVKKLKSDLTTSREGNSDATLSY